MMQQGEGQARRKAPAGEAAGVGAHRRQAAGSRGCSFTPTMRQLLCKVTNALATRRESLIFYSVAVTPR